MKRIIKKLWPLRLSHLYLLTMIVAFAPRYGDMEVDYRIPLLISGIWVLVALFHVVRHRCRIEEQTRKNLLFFTLLYLIPHLVIHLYTVILMLCGQVEWKYFTTNATVYVPVLVVISAVYLFGTKAMRYIFMALIGAFCLSALSSVILIGPHIIPDAIVQAYFDPLSAKNYLELHDVVLAVGYIMVYYLYRGKKLKRRDIVFLTCAVAISLLGMKRIVVLAILVCLAFAALIHIVPEKSRYRTSVFGGIAVFAGCFLFLWMLSAGDWFYDLMERLDINTAGRVYYYREVLALAEFDVFYPGIGRNVVTQLLEGPMSYLRVGGVHSDIIKMYVENGFLMFSAWMAYHLLMVPYMYKKYFGNRAAVMCFGITLYSFMLYLTDNIEVYFVCQTFAMIIPITYALRCKEGLYAGENQKSDLASH